MHKKDTTANTNHIHIINVIFDNLYQTFSHLIFFSPINIAAREKKDIHNHYPVIYFHTQHMFV